jgi:hypothetical protein
MGVARNPRQKEERCRVVSAVGKVSVQTSLVYLLKKRSGNILIPKLFSNDHLLDPAQSSL